MGGTVPDRIGTMLLMMVLGISSGFIVVPLNSLVQWRAPAACRGAVIAFINMVSFAGMMLAGMGARRPVWYLLDKLGQRACVLVFGSRFHIVGLAVALALVVASTFPPLWRWRTVVTASPTPARSPSAHASSRATASGLHFRSVLHTSGC